jgi:hypothetical protein
MCLRVCAQLQAASAKQVDYVVTARYSVNLKIFKDADKNIVKVWCGVVWSGVRFSPSAPARLQGHMPMRLGWGWVVGLAAPMGDGMPQEASLGASEAGLHAAHEHGGPGAV